MLDVIACQPRDPSLELLASQDTKERLKLGSALRGLCEGEKVALRGQRHELQPESGRFGAQPECGIRPSV